jgi:ribA/ribD-fused uncharacterized protein
MNKAERLRNDGVKSGVKGSDPIILFYKPADSYGGFSQFSHHKIWLTDPWTGLPRLYKSGEHRFQAMKAKTQKAHDFVCEAKTPSIAKYRGGPRVMDLREDWGNSHGDICWYVMLEVCIAKVSRHSDVLEDLSDTDQLHIYEDSETDDIWGWRFRNDYRGKNLLGKCWMETRSIIFADGR